MAKKNRDFQIVALVVLLILGCAKSATRLGSTKDGGEETVEEGNGREDGGLSSDADTVATEDNAEAQTGYAGSPGIARTGTDGIWIESTGGAGAVVTGTGYPVADVGGYGGSGGSPPPSAGAAGNDTEVIRPGRQILNPMECETDQPFVLGINPDGSSGFVEGWLESAPVVSFDGELPRFNALGEEGSLSLWWSISSTGPDSEPTVYFYGANDATSIAGAYDVERIQEITDATQLSYVDWSTQAVGIGSIVVFHHIPADRYLALRLDEVYNQDGAARDPSICIAISASWVFAPIGSADFSNVELPNDNPD